MEQFRKIILIIFFFFFFFDRFFFCGAARRESGSERPFLEKKNFISGNKNFVDRRLFVYIKCKIFLAASPKK